ncbi:MAG: DUF1648 domain-containing protein [Bacteroidota bacterium]
MNDRRQRPVLEIPLTIIEKNLEVISILVLIAPLLYIIAIWADLPETVPMHFRFDGTPDGWGSKYSIFLLIGVECIVYVGLTVLARFPHIYSYPWPITAENAQRQYTLARTLIRWIKLEVVMIFGYVLWGVVVSAKEQTIALSGVALALMLATTAVTVIVYMVQAGKGQ